MTDNKPNAYSEKSLDVSRFAHEGAVLEGHTPLAAFARLVSEAAPGALADDASDQRDKSRSNATSEGRNPPQGACADAPLEERLLIAWQAQGLMRRDPKLIDAVLRPALRLRASARIPLVCQRCLQPVWQRIEADRHFLFVSDEEEALRLDELADDDILTVQTRMNLLALIEDELLLEMPLAPRHDQCSAPLQGMGNDAHEDLAPGQAQAQGQAPDQDLPPHPFAALAALKKNRN